MFQISRLNTIIGLPAKHILLGLIIRESLAPWTGHPYDFEIWTRLGFYMQNLSTPYKSLAYVPGLSFSPISMTGSIGYPPLSAFIFSITFRVYSLLGEPSRFLYYFLLKQPSILADVATAVVLGKIILSSAGEKNARTSSLIWLYFPFGIIISSMWGQLDPIALFLTLLATYYFLASRWTFSAALLGVAIYLKLLPVIFLPIFLLQSRLGTSNKVLYSLVSLGIPAGGTLFPAEILNWNIQTINNYLSFQAAIPGVGGLSLLELFYTIPFVSDKTYYFTAFLWIPVLLISYLYVRKHSLHVVQGLALAILASVVSRPFFSEQYLVYPLAFLLAMPSGKNMRHFLGLAITATIYLVANFPLLVTFFAPLFPGFFNWNIVAWKLIAAGQSSNATLRALVMLSSIVACYVESFLILFGKESVVSQMVLSTKLLARIHKLKLSPIVVGSQ